jgi:hypothetical protein
MKNIHIIPTDKPSRLLYFGTSKELTLQVNPATFRVFERSTQNIYITSDEEIKEGDWFYNIISLKPEPFKACENGDGYVNCSKYSHYRIDCKKIILTDNKDLIKDGVQAIDDEFLEWFVKNPSCESVEIDIYSKKIGVETDTNGYREMDVFGNDYRIIIPQEEPKQIEDEFEMQSRIINKVWDEDEQETLEEAAEKEYPTPTPYIVGLDIGNSMKREAFIEGAKWQSERSYNEEEVNNMFATLKINSVNNVATITNVDLFISSWKKQFKNK